jgi:hypothetical protein
MRVHHGEERTPQSALHQRVGAQLRLTKFSCLGHSALRSGSTDASACKASISVMQTAQRSASPGPVSLHLQFGYETFTNWQGLGVGPCGSISGKSGKYLEAHHVVGSRQAVGQPAPGRHRGRWGQLGRDDG